MSKATLGDTIDIHIGGIEHIQVHHTNEIAQSESANGVKFVNYWLHHEMLEVDGGKMSKSKGNVYSLDDLISKGYNPLVLRYFFLLGHYRSKQNFTFEALDSAAVAFSRLINILQDKLLAGIGKVNIDYKEKFITSLSDDFNISKAVSVLWDLLKDKSIDDSDIIATALDFDKVLGLKLIENIETKIKKEGEELSPEILSLVQKRQEARERNDWTEADRLRQELKDKFNYNVIDK
jgi:cysteinyl-tRNA synthetase